ncbi:MAG: hypothetical protein ABJN04_08295 [Hyphomicrobiales bacterium]
MTRIFRLLSILLLAATFMVGDFKVPTLDGPSIAYAQKKKKQGFFQRLFGTRKKKKKIETRSAPKTTKKKQKRTRNSNSNRRASEARSKATAALPKLEDSNRILVIGDVTANALSQGLIDAYKRTPSVTITARVDKDIGITSTKFYDWLDASDFTFVGERVRAVVVTIGTFDRFSITQNNEPIAYGTEQWDRAYRRRMVDITAQLQLMGVPIIWMLPPPVIDDKNTEKAVAIGNLQTNSLATAGFRIVNAFGGFTNQQGQYRAQGASLTGARVQLRTFDGLGFTRRGANKFAYYARREIDRVLDDTLGLNFRLEAGAQKKRQANQVVNLTRPALRQNAQLSGSNGRVSAFFRDSKARNYFIEGKSLNAPVGRADDFAWGKIAQKRIDEAALNASRSQDLPIVQW